MRPTSAVKACCLCLSILFNSSAKAETLYYPVPSTVPLEVGAEVFRERYLSLRHLQGLYVDFSVIRSAGKDMGISIPTTLYKEAQEKIEAAGLRYLSEHEMLRTPGQPKLNLWPSYEGEARCKNPTTAQTEETEANSCNIPDNCSASLWVGLEQAASLLRQPENQYMLSTWGGGDKIKTCHSRGEWMAKEVLKQLDNLIADFKKAQRNLDPIVVGSTNDVPRHCSQSWVTHLNVFAADEARINQNIKPILDKLSNVAARCNTYSYIIETHADQRADADYNRLLTEARARSIKDYLITKGVEYHRIRMRPLGESAPIATGTTEADHAKNRRVVIIPLEPTEIENAALELE